ncbi:hypothetical protein PT974_06286 [Cladobotryum mycophilum]|uniref:Uncharacterized protein n=1 Tax=Cladobotryum mycophilum TaxID=491253 RepID=A0ABR0SL62_9HYPO
MSDQDREASLLEQQVSPAGGSNSIPEAAAAVAAAGSEHHDGGGGGAGESNQLPPFEPLFTLLTNNTTNSTVHPRVHYLFSDDDTSVLAAPQNDPSHRALIVDLAAPTAPHGNWSISWASSLSPDFAVTGSHLSMQEHDGEGDNDAGSLMLRVEGVEREPVDSRPNSMPNSSSGPVGREDAESLAEEFRRRMVVLKKVVGEGEKRRELLDQQVEGLGLRQYDEAGEGHEVESREETRANE